MYVITWSIAVMSYVVMHAWAFKGSCSPVIPCHWCLEWWWGRGVEGETKRSHRLQKVRIYWMSERCGGGRDHADEEKRQTVLDQASQRHFGTKITEFPYWLRWSECQYALGAPVLLFQLNLSGFRDGKANGYSGIHCRSPFLPSTCTSTEERL